LKIKLLKLYLNADTA